MTRPLLRIENYDLFSPANVLLQNLNIVLQKGEIQFLQGPNGTGKSTLLREIFSILSHKKQCPHIQFHGVESFSYLPQNLNREFYIPLSLGEVAKLAGGFKSPTPILHALVPPEISTRMWNTASGGEKQRAVLAQAFSSKHSLYLLDEPFNHLDTNSIAIIAKAIHTLTELGATFLISTHSVPPSLNRESIKTFTFDSTFRESTCH